MDSLLKDLERHAVSCKSGFVPESPSRALPNHYRPWEELAASLPVLLQSGDALIGRVASLPVLSTDLLVGDAEWQRAYVLLAFVIHGYVHGSRKKIVPLSLSEPFLQVCRHLGVEPVLSYAGLCIYNWTEGGDEGILDGLQAQATFTGTLDEAAFYLTPVLVERKGGHLPAQMLQALLDAENRDWQAVAAALEGCSSALKAMTDVLDGLKLLRPDTFWHQIRPYIAGLQISFERRDTAPLVVNLAGGSAAQSSLFQFLDHILGVKHANPLLEEMRGYMPRGHRDFLDQVEALPSLTQLATVGNADAQIWLKLDKCRAMVRKWRDRHIAIVTRYIVLPAQAAARKEGGKGPAVVGTAGSSPVAFLKEIRNDTVPTSTDS